MAKTKGDPENYPEEREARCSFCQQLFRTRNRLHVDGEFCFEQSCIEAHIRQITALTSLFGDSITLI